MRFLHTSDWHLGRILHGVHLTDDQSHVLDQFVDLVSNVKPDAVLIAGDIFDRAVPPPEAVCLLDEVLSKIVIDLDTHVLLISGNHDSAERLSFGSKIMSLQKLHVVGSVDSCDHPISIDTPSGPVSLYSIPYAEPPVVRQYFPDETELRDHNAAMHRVMERVRASLDPMRRSILMTHAFVTGGETCESERPLSVGGSGSIDASCFDGFTYVALGHLHRPQIVSGRTHVQYSGSLLKYSFSEATQEKSVALVTMDEQGECKTERISLNPKRDVRRISGKISELLLIGGADPQKDDYLSVELTDEGAIYDAIGQLRDVYPNVLQIERPFIEVDGQVSPSEDHRTVGELQLFSSFYNQVTGDEISSEQAEAYATILDALRARDREGIA